MTRAATWTLLRRLVLVALVVVIVVNPAFGRTTTQSQAADLQVLVVIDRTKSMDALDHDGMQPRIDGVREDLESFADALPGARFAVITFGALVRVEQPFTSDLTAFDTVVDTVRVERPFDGVGSLVDRPIEAMRVVLERAQAQQPDRRSVVLLVSDGENTTGGAGQRSFAPLADLVQGGAVLGYGTEAGGRMRFSDDPSDVDNYLTDPDTGDDAVSRLDESNLRTIAEQLGVPYEHPDGPADMAALAARLDAERVAGGEPVPADRSLTWLFALGVLALALLELRTAWRALATARRSRVRRARVAR